MFPQSRGSSTASNSIISTTSQSDVAYSCGTCGYALNLSSSDRDTTGIGSEYGKSIKKGVVSFVSVDESRFAQADELSCVPYFHSKRSWGLFRRRTRLLCRKCSNFIGVAYDGAVAVAAALPPSSGGDAAGFGGEAAVRKKYRIKICALQPSSDESWTPSSCNG